MMRRVLITQNREEDNTREEKCKVSNRKIIDYYIELIVIGMERPRYLSKNRPEGYY